MGYSGKIDVMIDFIEFESFWFDPTVHDISNNLYGFPKLQFFHNLSCLEFRSSYIGDMLSTAFVTNFDVIWKYVLKISNFDLNWAF